MQLRGDIIQEIFLKRRKKKGEQYCMPFLRKVSSPGFLRGVPPPPRPRVLYTFGQDNSGRWAWENAQSSQGRIVGPEVFTVSLILPDSAKAQEG